MCSITTAYGSNLSSFIDTVRAPSSIGCIIKITSNHFGLTPWHDSTHDRSSYLPTRRPTTFVSVTRLHIMPEKWPVRIGGNYFRSVLFYHESRERTLWSGCFFFFFVRFFDTGLVIISPFYRVHPSASLVEITLRGDVTKRGFEFFVRFYPDSLLVRVYITGVRLTGSGNGGGC